MHTTTKLFASLALALAVVGSASAQTKVEDYMVAGPASASMPTMGMGSEMDAKPLPGVAIKYGRRSDVS
ncbi:hypothetical protein [uncultured Aquabacterium sp.]|uniref:hypothetical protein n=1 Tax=uncultured Aquabacterium sp. TaxID=158753 RepID=UPI0030D06109